MMLHSGVFECLATFRGRNDSYIIELIVRSESLYVPPPQIDLESARHVLKGDPFSLKCAVTVDMNSIVELSWRTPNTLALQDGRVITPDTVSRNLSLPGSHLKIVEQVNTTA